MTGEVVTGRDALLAALRRSPAAARRVPAATLGRYVGIPFAERGYDRAGCNCWGLVTLVYRELLGIVLPRHDDAYDPALLGADAGASERRSLAEIVAARIAPDWRPVAIDQAAPFDVFLVPIGGQACHVALYVGDLRILHVEAGIDAVCEDLGVGRQAQRLARAGLFRHRAVEAARSATVEEARNAA